MTLRNFRSALLFSLLAFGSVSAHAQQPASPPSAANFRDCTANPVLAPSAKSSRKSKPPVSLEIPPACLELKGESLEIQEFLQSIIREFQWRTGESRASEDSWNFVRYLGAEELQLTADTQVPNVPVVFAHGKAAVTVRTTGLSAGWTRVQITALFQGEGKSSSAAVSQPGTVWPLKSKGVLESQLLDALKSRFTHAT